MKVLALLEHLEQVHEGPENQSVVLRSWVRIIIKLKQTKELFEAKIGWAPAKHKVGNHLDLAALLLPILKLLAVPRPSECFLQYLTTFRGSRIGLHNANCAASYSNVNFKSKHCLSCTQLIMRPSKLKTRMAYGSKHFFPSLGFDWQIWLPRLSYPRLSYPGLSYPMLSYPRLSYPRLGYPGLRYPR